MISGGIQGIGSLIGNLVGGKKKRQDMTNLAKHNMEREDTAIQRATADMEEAGWNKQLTASGGGGGQPASSTGAGSQTPESGIREGIQGMANMGANMLDQEIKENQKDIGKEEVNQQKIKTNLLAEEAGYNPDRIEGLRSQEEDRKKGAREGRINQIQDRLKSQIIDTGQYGGELELGIGTHKNKGGIFGGIAKFLSIEGEASARFTRNMNRSMGDVARQIEDGEITEAEAVEEIARQIEINRVQKPEQSKKPKMGSMTKRYNNKSQTYYEITNRRD